MTSSKITENAIGLHKSCIQLLLKNSSSIYNLILDFPFKRNKSPETIVTLVAKILNHLVFQSISMQIFLK